ncbi:MAG: hypothetical protein R3C05_03325 [Pirellulaceae bacterium]
MNQSPSLKTRLAVVCLTAFLSQVSTNGVDLSADDRTEQSSHQIGRQAMRSLGSVPWYDADEDSIKPIEPKNTDAAQWDSPARTSGFRGKQTVKAPSQPYNFLDIVGEVLGWSLIAVLVMLLLAAVVYGVMLHERRRLPLSFEPGSDTESEAESAERLQRLPVQLTHVTTNLLAHAHALMQAGRYNEAILYLFSHQLVQLDRHQLVRLTRGKTNRQYLQELSAASDLREILNATIHVFEDAFFGDHLISQQRFEFCWNQLGRFDAAIEAAHSLERLPRKIN